MMKKIAFTRCTTITVLLGMVLLLLAGCASRGPVAVKPPTVGVNYFNSTLITPEVVHLKAKILIQNRGKDTLDFDRVDYAVDLFGEELFNDSFDRMKKTSKRGSQTVTFPFQIAMSDILDQGIAALVEERVDITFRGIVYPDTGSGFSPLSFRKTISIPVPKIPNIIFSGAQGVPFGKQFALKLKVRNTNVFPVAVSEIDTYMEINEVKYRLLQTKEETFLDPNSWKILTLRMENTTGKTVSMILNTIQSPVPDFQLGGVIKCKSPYGWIVIPMELQITKSEGSIYTSSS
jgi:LEA14-like dessication related protein